jgi:hypothetical protein
VDLGGLALLVAGLTLVVAVLLNRRDLVADASLRPLCYLKHERSTAIIRAFGEVLLE